jgi:hypothetical protein
MDKGGGDNLILDKLSVKQLQMECAKRGLAKYGIKQTLINRLMSNSSPSLDQQSNAENPFSVEPANSLVNLNGSFSCSTSCEILFFILN